MGKFSREFYGFSIIKGVGCKGQTVVHLEPVLVNKSKFMSHRCSVRKKSQIGEPGSKCIFVWPIYLKIYEFFLSKKFRDEFRCFSIVSPNSEIFKIVIFKSKLCF